MDFCIFKLLIWIFVFLYFCIFDMDFCISGFWICDRDLFFWISEFVIWISGFVYLLLFDLDFCIFQFQFLIFGIAFFGFLYFFDF